MSGQAKALAAPRSLVRAGGSRALVECPAVTRAVGRSATDSETFWFTAWDWDTQAIWAAVRGFFDAYNAGYYDKCLDFMSETAVGRNADAAIDLLERAKSQNDQVSVEAITDLVIVGSRASGTVEQIVRCNIASQSIGFVKEKGSWKLSWPVLWNDKGFLTQD